MHQTVPLRADAARRRQQIVKAAARVMVSEGPEVPMERIAREAGVGVGTLYRRFPDRRALLIAVVEEGVQQLVDGLLLARQEEVTAWDALIRGMSQSVQVRLALGPDALGQRHLYVQVRDEPAVRRLYLQFAELLDDLVAAAQQEGDLRADVGAGDVARLFALVRTFPDVTHPDLDHRLADRNLAVIIDGLRAGSAGVLPGEPVCSVDLQAGSVAS